MRALTSLLALLALPAIAGPLNDTGTTQCYDGTTLVTCDAASTGDSATHPRQDGRFGRDAQAGVGLLVKSGGGAAGFDFTKIANDSNVLPATASLGPDETDWACTRDNHTGLIWEVKTDDGGLRDKDWTYRWGDTTGGTSCGGTLTQCNTDNLIAAANSAGLCGYTSGWRLPTRAELRSIVHHGVSNPSIDSAYFPNTSISNYSTSDPSLFAIEATWIVDFGIGIPSSGSKDTDFNVRLVRDGQ